MAESLCECVLHLKKIDSEVFILVNTGHKGTLYLKQYLCFCSKTLTRKKKESFPTTLFLFKNLPQDISQLKIFSCSVCFFSRAGSA